jgi:hypothetical protein
MYRFVIIAALVMACGSDKKDDTPVASVTTSPTPTPTPTAEANKPVPPNYSCFNTYANPNNRGASELAAMKTVKLGDKLADFIPEARTPLLTPPSRDTDYGKVEIIKETIASCATAETYDYRHWGDQGVIWRFYFVFCDSKIIKIQYCPADNAAAEVTALN